jgi:DNA-binding beta-propeller fold protein YncE
MAVTESADLLLGQINFTTKITDPTSQTMASPYGLAFSGQGLLVSDLGNNRVLFFPGQSQNLTSGEAATIVFGQPQMNSSSPGNGLNQMFGPHHIAVDSDDRLYVADTFNGRVLIFNRAPAAGNGAYAALTLTSGLRAPRGVNVNLATGDIWVADPGAGAAYRYPDFNNLIGSKATPPTRNWAIMRRLPSRKTTGATCIWRITRTAS